MSKVYWITKDGTRLDVDDMSDNYVRNAFKLLLRRINAHNNKRRDSLDLKALKEIDDSMSWNEM